MVCVPLPANLSPDDLWRILQMAQPRFAFLQAKLAAQNLAQFGSIPVIIDRQVPGLHAPLPCLSFDPCVLRLQRARQVYQPFVPKISRR